MGLFGRDLLAKAKPGIRIVNTARGGIVDEEALADAIRDGIVAGAGLDVFATEPCTESPLFELPGVVVSPHLGASTEEAQDKAGVTIAEQVLLALAGDFVPYAVNVAARDVTDAVRTFMGLAEQLGRFFVGLHDGLPDSHRHRVPGRAGGREHRHPHAVGAEGHLRRLDRGAGLLRQRAAAGRAARPEGPRVVDRDVTRLQVAHHVALGLALGGGHADHRRPAHRAAHRHGRRAHGRGAAVDHMLVVRNDDRPGVIGIVGTALGAAGVSISSMAVGPSPETSTAMMVISTTTPAPDVVVEQLRGDEGILDLHRVTL